MKLISLHVARVDASGRVVFLASKSEVSSFGFMERKPVRELANFLARQLLPRLSSGERKAVSHEGYISCSMRWSDQLGVIALVDKEYPMRVAFQLLTEVHEAFRRAVPAAEWRACTEDNGIAYKEQLKEWLKKYQDPTTFDATARAMQKCDDTKAIMQQNIEKVLGNYEQIERLLEKSEDISAQSEMMFKAAKKTNKGCCKMQ